MGNSCCIPPEPAQNPGPNFKHIKFKKCKDIKHETRKQPEESNFAELKSPGPTKVHIAKALGLRDHDSEESDENYEIIEAVENHKDFKALAIKNQERFCEEEDKMICAGLKLKVFDKMVEQAIIQTVKRNLAWRSLAFYGQFADLEDKMIAKAVLQKGWSPQAKRIIINAVKRNEHGRALAIKCASQEKFREWGEWEDKMICEGLELKACVNFGPEENETIKAVKRNLGWRTLALDEKFDELKTKMEDASIAKALNLDSFKGHAVYSYIIAIVKGNNKWKQSVIDNKWDLLKNEFDTWEVTNIARGLKLLEKPEHIAIVKGEPAWRLLALENKFDKLKEQMEPMKVVGPAAIERFLGGLSDLKQQGRVLLHHMTDGPAQKIVRFFGPEQSHEYLPLISASSLPFTITEAVKENHKPGDSEYVQSTPRVSYEETVRSGNLDHKYLYSGSMRIRDKCEVVLAVRNDWKVRDVFGFSYTDASFPNPQGYAKSDATDTFQWATQEKTHDYEYNFLKPWWEQEKGLLEFLWRGRMFKVDQDGVKKPVRLTKEPFNYDVQAAASCEWESTLSGGNWNEIVVGGPICEVVRGVRCPGRISESKVKALKEEKTDPTGQVAKLGKMWEKKCRKGQVLAVLDNYHLDSRNAVYKEFEGTS
jgi:hypothetical protein